jgi:hypothetical protein
VRNPHSPKSGIRGVTWNSQFQRWHVRIRVIIDGKSKYASFGLYDDLAEAAEVAEKARAGVIEPRVLGIRDPRPAPRYVTTPGLTRPNLTEVATCDLIAELTRRKAI